MTGNTLWHVASSRRTIPKPEDRGEWLAARRGYFNASSAAVLWDRHPFQSPGDYATVKLTDQEQPPSRAMKRGQRLEDVIAQWWAEENHRYVEEPDVLFIVGRLMATVDRMVTTPGDDNGMPVEIKTTARDAPHPEPYWLDQCQAILACTGAPRLELVWFDSSLDIRSQLVTADLDLQETMLARVERFMAAIDLGFAPDWVMLSSENIAAIYDKPADAVDFDDDALDLVRSYDTVRRIRLDAEKHEAAIKDELARLMLDKDTARYDGIDILTWKAVNNPPKFNQRQFREDHPELYDAYLREPKPSRQFHLKIGVP